MANALFPSLLALLLAAAAQGETLTLSLEQALAQAEAGAHAIDVATAVVDEAVARQEQTRAGYLPGLAISEELSRGDDPVAAFGTRLRQQRFTTADFDPARLNQPDPVTNLRTVIEVNQPLFSSGRTAHSHRAASAALQAASGQQRHTRSSVRLQTAAAYWRLALASASVHIVDVALLAARQHAADAEAGWRAGTVSRSEGLATQLRVTELLAQRIDARTDQLSASDELTLWLGLPAGTELALTDELETAPLVAAAVSAHAHSDPAQRADLQAARWQQRAAEHDVQMARGAAMPQLGAFARYAIDSHSLSGVDGSSWMAGAVLRWDLFTGFSDRSAIDAARARSRRASAATAQLTAQVQREVLAAERSLAAARRQIDVALAALRHADEQLRIVSAESAAGVASVSDRLDAEAVWQLARLRHLQALHNAHVGLAQLEFASGPPLPSTQD